MIQTFGLGAIALLVAAVLARAGIGLAIPPVPIASPGPTAIATDLPFDPIDTPAEALAAVVAAHPELAGYRLIGAGARGGPGPVIGGPGGIGGSMSVVLAAIEPQGIVLSFISTSGDCPSGCTDEHIDTFLVTPDGTVSPSAPLAAPLETGPRSDR